MHLILSKTFFWWIQPGSILTVPASSTDRLPGLVCNLILNYLYFLSGHGFSQSKFFLIVVTGKVTLPAIMKFWMYTPHFSNVPGETIHSNVCTCSHCQTIIPSKHSALVPFETSITGWMRDLHAWVQRGTPGNLTVRQQCLSVCISCLDLMSHLVCSHFFKASLGFEELTPKH